ncbi:solute carrier family 22 member 6-like [Amblyomma americanum]
MEPLRTAAVSTKGVPTEASRNSERQLPYGDGKFQLLILFSTTATMGVFGLHYDSFKLTAGVMDHWCRRPHSFANLSVSDWKRMAIPLDERVRYNIVSEWVLVCDRLWLIEVARLVCSVTCVASLPVVGALADRVGRKTVVFIAIPVVLIAGTGSSVPKDFQFFVAVRAVVSAATSVLMPPMLAVFYEVTPSSKIPAYATAAALLSIVMTPITLFFAQLYRAGWATLQLILMIPTCLLVLLYYCVDESPAWLSATGQVREAERVALRAASLNKVSLQLCRDMLAQQELDVSVNHQDAVECCGLCRSHLRPRTILLAYMWTALSYAYDTFVISDGVAVSDTVTVVGYIASVTACFLAVHCIVRFGFRSIVVASGLAFGTSSAILALTYSQNETLMRDSLVIFMRVAGSVCFTFFVPQSLGAYPVITHCRGAAWNVAFSRIGDNLAQAITAHLGDRHTDLRLAVAAAVMSLFAVSAQVLPYEYEWVLQGRSTSDVRRIAASAEESKRAMQDTLVPLPKQPLKRRIPTEPDRVSLPAEQYSSHSIQKSLAISLG